MNYYIEDEKGRFYRSKNKEIKAKSFKWTSDLTKATLMSTNQAKQLVNALTIKGIFAQIKTL